MNGVKYRQNDDMRDGIFEYLERIPQDWKIIKNGILFYFGRGRVISKEEIGDNQGEYPVYSSQTANNGILGYLPKYEFDGDYITWTTDGANAGTVFRRRGKFNCTNVCGTMKSKYSIDLSFATYILSTLTKRYVRIDINPKLMNNQMKEIKILYPSIDEQQKIANFLNIKTAQFDSIIAKKELLIQKLEKAKKSLISEVVTGKVKIIDGEIVSRKPEEMKDSGVEWLGMIPKDWVISKLGHITTKITDGAHISPETEDGLYPFISVKDLKERRLDFENCLLTSTRSYKYLARNSCNPRSNDVLISKDGSIGQTTVINFNKQFVVASSLVIITPIKNMNSYYVEYVLNSNYFQEQIKRVTKGAALPRLSIHMLKNCKALHTKNEDEQAKIVHFLDEKVNSLLKSIMQVKSQIEGIKEARQALISEAVTGKIDLRDWEIVVEGEPA